MRTPIPRYTFLAFKLNHLLDEGKRLDPDETRSRLDDATFFDWIEELFSNELDLSLYDAEERETMMRAMASIALAVNERRKFGVENNGICLALSYCIQILQAGPEDYEGGV